MISVKVEMPKIGDIYVVVLEHGKELSLLREDGYWYDEIKDIIIEDTKVISWEEFFPN